MTQGLSALFGLAEDWGLFPSPHMAADNCLLIQYQEIQRPLLTSMCTRHTCDTQINM